VLVGVRGSCPCATAGRPRSGERGARACARWRRTRPDGPQAAPECSGFGCRLQILPQGEDLDAGAADVASVARDLVSPVLGEAENDAGSSPAPVVISGFRSRRRAASASRRLGRSGCRDGLAIEARHPSPWCGRRPPGGARTTSRRVGTRGKSRGEAPRRSTQMARVDRALTRAQCARTPSGRSRATEEPGGRGPRNDRGHPRRPASISPLGPVSRSRPRST